MLAARDDLKVDPSPPVSARAARLPLARHARPYGVALGLNAGSAGRLQRAIATLPLSTDGLRLWGEIGLAVPIRRIRPSLCIPNDTHVAE
jgi:hypothetical protein